jgi:NADH dehydrogenase
MQELVCSLRCKTRAIIVVVLSLPAFAIIEIMILVTGGTGFIGQALIRQLTAMGYQVRTLIRPSKTSPSLPRGVSVEAVVCGLNDARGLRSAMREVETVYHLAGAEFAGNRPNLQSVDIDGSRAVAEAAHDAGVGRIIFLSHLGADRASAYPVLKAKGIAERYIMQCGVASTIFRSAVVYGEGDHLTIPLSRLLRMNPFLFLMPGDGAVQLQPIAIDDLVTTLTLALEDEQTVNQVYSIGGPEFLTFRQITDLVAENIRAKRLIVPVPPAYLRLLAVWLDQSWRKYPISIFWQDYLAADRTCEIDTLPRNFGLMPERMSKKLDYLRHAIIETFHG